MFALRIIGIVLTFGGIGLFAAEALWPGQEGFELRALGWWWAEIHRDSLLLLQPAVERYLLPEIWDPGIQTLLQWPAAPQLLLLGLLLWWLGRRGARKKVKRQADRLTFRSR
ncbi:MAG: hypothetical protein AAGE80_18285 [Pseudomonadota bacterium]